MFSGEKKKLKKTTNLPWLARTFRRRTAATRAFTMSKENKTQNKVQTSPFIQHLCCSGRRKRYFFIPMRIIIFRQSHTTVATPLHRKNDSRFPRFIIPISVLGNHGHDFQGNRPKTVQTDRRITEVMSSAEEILQLLHKQFWNKVYAFPAIVIVGTFGSCERTISNVRIQLIWQKSINLKTENDQLDKKKKKEKNHIKPFVE